MSWVFESGVRSVGGQAKEAGPAVKGRAELGDNALVRAGTGQPTSLHPGSVSESCPRVLSGGAAMGNCLACFGRASNELEDDLLSRDDSYVSGNSSQSKSGSLPRDNARCGPARPASPVCARLPHG